MLDHDAPTIREIPIFSALSDKHFDDLIQMSLLQHFPSQTQLTTEGDVADVFHVVVEGTVELFSSSNDRDATLFLVRAVSAFNLSAVLNKAIYLLSARTLGEAKVLMIPAENVRSLMEMDPLFSTTMVMELAKRYRIAINALKEQRLRSGLERLANYLLRENEISPVPGQVLLTEDKRKLAALIGVTPEYLSRAFNSLKQYGVEVQGRKINLTNLDALSGFARPNPMIDLPNGET